MRRVGCVRKNAEFIGSAREQVAGDWRK